MTLNFFINSLLNFKRDRFLLYSVVNLYIKELNKLNKNILKYNENYVMKVVFFNDINDDAKTILNFTNLINKILNNLIILITLFITNDYTLINENIVV